MTNTERPANTEADELDDAVRSAIDTSGIARDGDMRYEYCVPVRAVALDRAGRLQYRYELLCPPNLDPAVRRDILRRALRSAEQED